MSISDQIMAFENGGQQSIRADGGSFVKTLMTMSHPLFRFIVLAAAMIKHIDCNSECIFAFVGQLHIKIVHFFDFDD